MASWIREVGVENGGGEGLASVAAGGGESVFGGRLIAGIEEDVAVGEFDDLNFVWLKFWVCGNGIAGFPGFALVVAESHVNEPAVANALIVGNDDTVFVFALSEDDAVAGTASKGVGFGVFDLGGEIGGGRPSSSVVCAGDLIGLDNFGAGVSGGDVVFVGVGGIVLVVEDEGVVGEFDDGGVVEGARFGFSDRFEDEPGATVVDGLAEDDVVSGGVGLGLPSFGEGKEGVAVGVVEGRDAEGVVAPGGGLEDNDGFGEEEREHGGLENDFATEAACGVIGIGSVVVDEHAVETAVAEDGSAQGADFGGRLEPA